MTTRITTLIRISTTNILRLALLGSFVTAAPLLATANDSAKGHARHAPADQARLVQLVRNATQGFRDVSNVPAGYGPFLGCVSGPDHGAMGKLPFSYQQGFVRTAPSGPNACDFAEFSEPYGFYQTGGELPHNPSIVYAYVGVVASHQTLTVTMAYRGT